MEFAHGLAKALGADIVDIDSKVFPDGESKIRILSDVRNISVILVQSTYPPVDSHLMQALFLGHRLSEEGAEVHALIPYLAYSRQDKEFLKGEVVSLGVVVRLLRAVGVKRLITVDIHGVEGLGYFSFPAYSVSAIPLLADFFRTSFALKSPVAISPDFGASARVEAFAKALSSQFVVLSKKRDRATGEVQMETKGFDAAGHDVIIVDDIISTGGTVQKAASIAKSNGARKVYAACIHPLLVQGALEKIRAAGVDEVIGTNTVPSPVSKVDVTPAVVSYFQSLK